MDLSTLGFWHDLLTSTMHHDALPIMLSHSPHGSLYTQSTSQGLYSFTSIYTTYPIWNLSLSTSLKNEPLPWSLSWSFQSWHCWETLRGHVLSELRNASTQPGLQSEDAVVAYVHGEVAERLWEKGAAGRPLSVSNWPWWRRGGWVPSPCSPGTLPSGPQGGRELDRLRKLRWDWSRTFGLHLSLPPQSRSGRRGEPETGGPTPHQLAVQPASAHSQGNFPFSSSSPLRQLTASIHFLSAFFTTHPFL